MIRTIRIEAVGDGPGEVKAVFDEAVRRLGLGLPVVVDEHYQRHHLQGDEKIPYRTEVDGEGPHEPSNGYEGRIKLVFYPPDNYDQIRRWLAGSDLFDDGDVVQDHDFGATGISLSYTVEGNTASGGSG